MSDANSSTQRPIGLKLGLKHGRRMIELGSKGQSSRPHQS